ncbi:MAG TPA: spore germination protein GerW family protein [Solirubrobacteraceae bacterium]|nr:spore germination protein GerW family protein [Solirubrobacteraceae bacterium]
MAKPSKQLPPLQRAIARATGARLCFGAPVELGKRTVIPVASVRTAGGWGFGNHPESGDRAGGGGGGALDARPVGFIEISPDGARFQRIDDGRMALRAMAAASLAVLVAGRVVRRRRGGLALPRVPLRRRLTRGSAQASQSS